MWLPQISMLPFVMLCVEPRSIQIMLAIHDCLCCNDLQCRGTASTSALWCTPEGVVLSLGPVPLCIFRRRIPYRSGNAVMLREVPTCSDIVVSAFIVFIEFIDRDITSVAVVRGRKSVRLARFSGWQWLQLPWTFLHAIFQQQSAAILPARLQLQWQRTSCGYGNPLGTFMH